MPKSGISSCVSAGRIADAEGSAPHGGQPIYSDFRVTLPIKPCAAVFIEFDRDYLDIIYKWRIGGCFKRSSNLEYEISFDIYLWLVHKSKVCGQLYTILPIK